MDIPDIVKHLAGYLDANAPEFTYYTTDANISVYFDNRWIGSIWIYNHPSNLQLYAGLQACQLMHLSPQVPIADPGSYQELLDAVKKHKMKPNVLAATTAYLKENTHWHVVQRKSAVMVYKMPRSLIATICESHGYVKIKTISYQYLTTNTILIPLADPELYQKLVHIIEQSDD